MSRQETPTQNQTTGAHRKHRAPAGRAARQEAVPKDVPAGGEPRTEGSRAARRDTSRADTPRKAGRKDSRTDSRKDSRKEAGPRTAQHGSGSRRRPHGTLPMQPPSHYEPYLDGLFTYCLSILCEHDAAAAALGEVLALAERQRGHLRDPRQRRPWLYALARWTCLRRLAAGPPDMPSTSAAVAEQRNAQLAALAWPEAAGTTPEQREALELAVRHQLPPVEVAAVLGIDADTARGLLARAACEVERTRTALSVVDTGHCAALAQLAGETKVLLGTALRTELVRHVDDCPVCRRTAERVVASGPWPGAAGAGATAVLALIEAPRSAAYAALLHAMDAGAGRSRDATPRFDRRGFPMDLKDRAARRAQIRHRAVTSTVVAAVVAAPVLALWAAYHGSPLGGDAPGSRTAASEPDGPGDVYQEAGSSRRADGPKHTGGTDTPSPVLTTTVSTDPTASGSPTSPGGGTLTVAATGTTVTLTAGGSAPVHWSATSDAYWIRLSATSGDLQPGESVILRLSVVRSLEPSGSWTARIAFSPAHATVILRGSSTRSVPPPASGDPTDPGDPTDTPTTPPPSSDPPTSPPPTTDPPTTPPPTTDPPTTPPPTTPPTTPTESQSPTPTE